ncbi:cardiolipin synthase (CMP-forming) isoform X2 [Girardinichthys multiradiatus]|uniref:cardiolipin synthase (CMP-forming) isoform X2 n=1 Tax=Girardinichthys multiradiatus TaxID=208333 RepID=UPI001FAB8CC3|nr:cardiolipin synthase (CMP-forming) isoform X2 [Girardinichthys multiradiatus]
MITTRLGRISVPLFYKAANISERCAGVCRLAPAIWRIGQPPSTVNVGLTQPRLSGWWLFKYIWTDCRGTGLSWSIQRLKHSGLPQVSVLVHRRGLGRSVAGLRPLLLPGARGLSSRKTEEAPDKSAAAGGDTVPGDGLFKFKELYENPWTVPNLLCVCRILLAPYLGYLITQQHFDLSLALFALAGATDLLDGLIARTWPTQKSALGSALDPLADKILISVLYVTLSKFFNPCYTTAQLKPTLFSKINTAIQLFLVAASLTAPVFQFTDSVLLQCLWYITAVTTAASGYSYWHYGRKTVQVLNTRSP